MFTKFKTKNQLGFTGIEVLMVLTIVIIVTVLVTNNIKGALAEARDAERRLDITDIHQQLEGYWHTHESYPIDLTDIIGGSTNPGAFFDPDNVTILYNAATDSDAEPVSGYTADKKPESQYLYAPYDCINLDDDTETEESDEAETKADEGEEPETNEAEEVETEVTQSKPVCKKYVIYTWLEKPTNPEIPYFKKTNLHDN